MNTLLIAPGPTVGEHRTRIASRRLLASRRAEAARSALAECRLCVHDCGVDRRGGPAGRCHAGAAVRYFSAQTEVADELDLLPTFAIALSGCNLRCDFCVTGESSWNPAAGAHLELDAMACRAALALDRGARTIMILGGEPTIHLPALLDLVAALPDEARLVLKTNACFSRTARPLLANLFDVWLPDFKFGNDDCALHLADIRSYWDTLVANLAWMATQRPDDSLMVRHLLMPGHIECCWAPIAHWLGEHLAGVPVSLRLGYLPAWHAHRHSELRRTLTPQEVERALALSRSHRLRLAP